MKTPTPTPLPTPEPLVNLLTYGCGHAASGTVYCWGFALDKFGMQYTPTQVAGTNWVDLSSWERCGLSAAGDVTCIRDNYFATTPAEAFTVEPQNLGNLKLVSLEGYCGMGTDGKAWCWPFGGAPSRVPGQAP